MTEMYSNRLSVRMIAGAASVLLLLLGNACGGNASCAVDGDCADGEVCVKSGGVFFGQNECIPKGLVDGSGTGDAGDMCRGGMGQEVPSFDPSSCQTSNSGVEICDGKDNDCNGRIDDCVEPTACALDEGICAGATTVTCAANGAGYATCGADQYGEAFVSQDDEAWMCDGLDNDCDGTVDEFCCNQSDSGASSFNPTDIGQLHVPDVFPPYDGVVLTKLARPLSNAPEDAVALVAMKTNQGEVTLKYVDASGADVGQSNKITVGGTFTGGVTTIYQEISGLALVTMKDGYHLIIGRTDIHKESDKDANLDGTSLLTRTLDADLKVDASNQLASPSDIQTRLAAGYLDGRVVLISNEHNSWTQISAAEVVARTYEFTEKTGPAVLSRISLPNIVETNLDVGGGQPSDLLADANIDVHPQQGMAVGWATKGQSSREGEINVVTIDPSGNVFGAATSIRSLTTSVSRDATSRFGIAWTGEDRVTVVFDKRIGLGAVELNTRTGSLENRIELSNEGRAPSMVTRDSDGDSYADQATIVWQSVDNAMTGASGSSWGFETEQTLTGKQIMSNRQGLGFPTVLGVTDGAAVAWPERPSQGKAHALFAAVGNAGGPVCPPGQPAN